MEKEGGPASACQMDRLNRWGVPNKAMCECKMIIIFYLWDLVSLTGCWKTEKGLNEC